MNSSLHNYIRTERKRVELSQRELGLLLGIKASSVSRHEIFARAASLETALRYAVIFDLDPRDLFAGLFEHAQGEVKKRAQRLTRSAPDGTVNERVALLADDADDVRYVPEYNSDRA